MLLNNVTLTLKHPNLIALIFKSNIYTFKLQIKRFDM